MYELVPTDMISLIKQGNIEDMNKFLSYSAMNLSSKKEEWKKKTKNYKSI